MRRLYSLLALILTISLSSWNIWGAESIKFTLRSMPEDYVYSIIGGALPPGGYDFSGALELISEDNREIRREALRARIQKLNLRGKWRKYIKKFTILGDLIDMNPESFEHLISYIKMALQADERGPSQGWEEALTQVQRDKQRAEQGAATITRLADQAEELDLLDKYETIINLLRFYVAVKNFEDFDWFSQEVRDALAHDRSMIDLEEAERRHAAEQAVEDWEAHVVPAYEDLPPAYSE